MQPHPIRLRLATHEDLVEIVRMLADDPLGAKREEFTLPLPSSYEQAFRAIDTDPNQELTVATIGGESETGDSNEIIGVLQITFIPYLTYRGGWRALIEGVRVDRKHRGSGIGRQLFEHAIERARQRGCHLVQLTTDKARPDALHFYEALGFVASHEGMKLHLPLEAAPSSD